MAVNPLLKREQDRQDAAKTAKTAAEAAATAADTEVGNKKTLYNQQVSDKAQLAQQIALIRKALALVDGEADGTELAKQLQQKVVASRSKDKEIVAAARDLTQAKVKSLRAGTVAADARAALANATSALAEATTADQRRVALTTAAGALPISQVGAGATAALAGPEKTAAETRLKNDLTPELFALADSRAKVEDELVNLSRKKAQKAQTDLDAELGEAAKQRAALARAEDALSEFVNNVTSSLKAALGAFEEVADPANSPLTAAQSASIKDADKLDARKNAAAHAKAVADAQAAALAAGTEFDDLADDATVKSAMDDFPAEEQTTIEDWVAEVPDDTWLLLAEYEHARGTLEELKTGVAPLVAAMSTAETKLAAELTTAETKSAKLAKLKGDAQDAELLAEGAEAEQPARVLVAARGDK